MSALKTILRSVKPFLGKMDVHVDRSRQIISFNKNDKTETLTVNQLFDEIEGIFSKAMQKSEKAIYQPFWLTNCDKPITSPLSFINQPVIKPARPLAASQL